MPHTIKAVDNHGFSYLWSISNIAHLWHIQNRLKHIRLAIKNREKQGFFAKIGHFDQKFTQPALESIHSFLSTCALPAPKFPAKITGIFL